MEFLSRSLQESGLEVTEHPELSTVSFTHAGDQRTWEVFCRSRHPVPQVMVYSLHPRIVPEDRRLAMMELLTRANYGLVIGNFEMDPDDGELRFKTSIDFGSDRLSGALLARLVQHNLDAFEQYLPAVEAVIDGGDDLQRLLDQVESTAPDEGWVVPDDLDELDGFEHEDDSDESDITT